MLSLLSGIRLIVSQGNDDVVLLQLHPLQRILLPLLPRLNDVYGIVLLKIMYSYFEYKNPTLLRRIFQINKMWKEIFKFVRKCSPMLIVIIIFVR